MVYFLAAARDALLWREMSESRMIDGRHVLVPLNIGMIEHLADVNFLDILEQINFDMVRDILEWEQST